MAEVRVEGQSRICIDYTGGTVYQQPLELSTEQGGNNPDLLTDLSSILDVKTTDVSLHQLARVLRNINFFLLDDSLKEKLLEFISQRFNQIPSAITSEAIEVIYSSGVSSLCRLTENHFSELNSGSSHNLEYYTNYPYPTGINNFSNFEVSIYGEPEIREYLTIKGDGIITAFIKKSFISPTGQVVLPNCYYRLQLSEAVAHNIRAVSIRRFISQHLVEIEDYFANPDSSKILSTTSKFLGELFFALHRYTNNPIARSLMYQVSNTRKLTGIDIDTIEEQLLELINMTDLGVSLRGPIQIYFDREAMILEQ